MQTTTTPKNKTEKKTTSLLSRKPGNIFDLIFGLDTSFLKILAEEGSKK
jgi:hypothetical protein